MIVFVGFFLQHIQIHVSTDKSLVMVLMVMMVVMTAQNLGRFDVLFQFFHVAFEFGASILEPGDHLGVGQSKRQCDLSIEFEMCRVISSHYTKMR